MRPIVGSLLMLLTVTTVLSACAPIDQSDPQSAKARQQYIDLGSGGGGGGGGGGY